MQKYSNTKYDVIDIYKNKKIKIKISPLKMYQSPTLLKSCHVNMSQHAYLRILFYRHCDMDRFKSTGQKWEHHLEK